MSTPSADPKIVGNDAAAAAKKSSKKVSSKRSVDGITPPPSSPAATTAPSLSTVPDVPRLQLAEPKAELSTAGEGTERAAKSRPAKKRTATPETTVVASPGPSLPQGVVQQAPSSTKSDVDAEKERAKREAKKQRARELEEQRKREDLERQAIEEARKREEQRQRELRRQQDLAVLNANADVVQEEEDTGYDDEGFEDYGDDFEKEDDAPPATARAKAPVQQAKPLAKAKGVPKDAGLPADAVDLRRIQEAQKAESKELASASRPTAKATRKSTASSGSKPPAVDATKAVGSSSATALAASIAGLKQTLDPRTRRAKEIRDTRRLDVEKFNTFVQPPQAEGEIYMSRLRRGVMRQVGGQTGDDNQTVGTQTNVPEMQDKSMHFPDDVGVDDSATRLVVRGSKRRATGGGGNNQEEDDADEQVATVSSMRFISFLEQTSQVCELLIEDNLQAREAQLAMQASASETTAVQLSPKATLSQTQLFPTTKNLDQPGVEELLQGRELLLLRFSPAVSNVLVSWYAPETSQRSIPTEQEAKATGDTQDHRLPSDSLPTRSIACVWDINQLHQPSYILKGDGVVTSSCLSPCRELMVVAGTEDGTINVWDLRSRLALVGGKRSSPLNLTLYAPTYSTSGCDARSVEGSHQSSIVAVECVERGDGLEHGTFQFGSLDDRGMLVMWSIVDFSDAHDADTLLADKCVEIGGRIKLVATVAIDTQLQYLVLTRPALRLQVRKDPSYLSEITSASRKRRADGVALYSTGKKKPENDPISREVCAGPIAATFQFFPNDPNQFIVGTTSGLVLRGARYTQSHASSSAATAASSATVQCYRRERHGVIATPTPMGIAVTALAFHPSATSYFLVGYADGRICLFDTQFPAALSTWEEVDYDKSVVSLQWSPSRPEVFFASYSHGRVHAWDLTAQRHAPSFEYDLTTSSATHRAACFQLSLSSEKMRTSRPSIAMSCSGEEPFHFQVHELGTEFTASARTDAAAVEQLLASMF